MQLSIHPCSALGDDARFQLATAVRDLHHPCCHFVDASTAPWRRAPRHHGPLFLCAWRWSWPHHNLLRIRAELGSAIVDDHGVDAKAFIQFPWRSRFRNNSSASRDPARRHSSSSFSSSCVRRLWCAFPARLWSPAPAPCCASSSWSIRRCSCSPRDRGTSISMSKITRRFASAYVALAKDTLCRP